MLFSVKELVLPLLDCFNRGFDEVVLVGLGDGGERLILLLLVDEVNAFRSARIDDADDGLVVDSGVLFFSLNPVANDAQPLAFFGVVPFVSDELELDTVELLLVELSDVIDSDD